jgi:hypothetical protein
VTETSLLCCIRKSLPHPSEHANPAVTLDVPVVRNGANDRLCVAPNAGCVDFRHQSLLACMATMVEPLRCEVISTDHAHVMCSSRLMLVEGKRGVANPPQRGQARDQRCGWVWLPALMQVPLRKKIIWHNLKYEELLSSSSAH